MFAYQLEYGKKLVKAEEASKLVRSDYGIWYPGFNGKPVSFDRALAARKEELRGVVINNVLTVPPLPETALCDPTTEHFAWVCWHFSIVDRKLHDVNRAWYGPIHYHEAPRVIRMGSCPPVDMVVLQVTPMDKYGFFNIGPQVSHAMALVEQCKARGGTVIVEVNHKMPRCLGGYDESLHISMVDYIIEGDNPDLYEVPSPPATKEDEIIAGFILEKMRDRDCIQLGIGGAPSKLGSLIAESDLKDLGAHTEMLCEAYLEMYEKGRITNRYKALDRGRMVYTFALGSKRLYDFLDNNPVCCIYPVDYTNHPGIASKNDNLVSINNAVMVDLFGQVTGESDGYRQISGMGGMLDFAIAGYESNGGRSFIILHATHQTGDKVTSRIVPRLPEGTVVTIPRAVTQYVVTEYGMVNLKYDSTWGRAEKLISIAAPQFRDELIKEAEKMKIWRRTNKQDS